MFHPQWEGMAKQPGKWDEYTIPLLGSKALGPVIPSAGPLPAPRIVGSHIASWVPPSIFRFNATSFQRPSLAIVFPMYTDSHTHWGTWPQLMYPQ